MAWSKHRGRAGRGRRGYHHGNLREALVEAALDLISEKGPAGFTFAEAARFAGVSPAAPTHSHIHGTPRLGNRHRFRLFGKQSDGGLRHDDAI